LHPRFAAARGQTQPTERKRRREKKPTDSLYHLSHGQREPVSFLVRPLPETNVLGKSKRRTNSRPPRQLIWKYGITFSQSSSYNDFCRRRSREGKGLRFRPPA
jgi:hypothetical protein